MITTKYDNVNGVKKRVFYVRGDEEYAKSTDIKLSMTTPVADGINGFKTSFTINLYRTRGNSTVTLYDNEEVIHMFDTTSSTSTLTLTDQHFSYGNNHDFRAVYHGNVSCHESKSKLVSVSMNPPAELTPSIVWTSSGQINNGDPVPIDFTVTLDDTPLSDCEVSIYIDDDLYDDAVTTDENGQISDEITGIEDGSHKLTAIIGSTEQFNGVTSDKTVYVGYDVAITEYPSNFIVGTNNTIKVSVKTFGGVAVNNGTAYIGSNSASVSNGVATFTLSSLASDTIYANYYDSLSESVTINETTITNITATAPYPYVAEGYTTSVYFTVSGTGNLKDVPVSISVNNVDKGAIYTDNNGKAYYNLQGTSSGAVNVKGTVASQNSTVSIEDVFIYYNGQSDLNLSKSNLFGGVNLITSYNGLSISGVPSPNLKGVSFNIGDVDGVAYSMEFDVTNSDLSEWGIGFVNNPLNILSHEDNLIGKSIKFIKQADNTGHIYINNVEKYQVTNSSSTYHPIFCFVGRSITIQNLKIKRL